MSYLDDLKELERKASAVDPELLKLFRPKPAAPPDKLLEYRDKRLSQDDYWGGPRSFEPDVA